MDLVASIRKEGSRGGRDSFKWSDVKESSHRENYLGHSLMAPVGRWQQGRDLNWYAKDKEGDSADKEKQERAEELRRVKEAEQDAMALALGLPVAPRASSNANLTPLGGNEVRKAIQETTDMDDNAEDRGRGIGFGSYGGGLVLGDGAEGETLAAVGMDSQDQPTRGQDWERGHSFSRRNRSRDRRRDRDHNRDSGTRHKRDKDRDAHQDRSEHRHHRHREHRERSRSPRRGHRDRRRDDNRERRHDSDVHRDPGRHERRRSSSAQPGRSDRGDHHRHDSRRDRDHDRSHRDRRR